LSRLEQINYYAPLRATATLFGRLGLSGRSLVIAVPTLWLFVFFLIPFFVVAKISLSKAAISQPPFLPLYEWTSDGSLKFNVFFSNYQFLFSDPLYVNAYLNSIKIALISTIIALLIGYPIAYYIARSSESRRNILLMLIMPRQ
jgi:putrescine transport system permease protein